MLREGEDYNYYDYKPEPFFYVPDSKELPGDTIPADGLQYLQLVKQEREKCENTVVPLSQIPKKQNKKSKFVLSKENLAHMKNVFADARNCVNSNVLKQNYALKEGEQLPSENDMLNWCAFCLGSEAASQLDVKVTHNVKQKYNFQPEGYEPYNRFIFSMSKCVQVKLLSYIDTWLRRLGFSPRLGLWAYAILLVLETPLTPNAEEVLSFLAGTCLLIRSNMRNEDDLLNISRIYCAIKCYFGCKAKKLVKQSNVKSKNKTVSREPESSSESSSDSDISMYY